MLSDAELMRRHGKAPDSDSFAELVQRHLNLVYGAAFRRTGGDADLAAEISQTVFISLHRTQPPAGAAGSLAGWLYTATRNAAINAVIAQSRRRAREQEAFQMQQSPHDENHSTDWTRLRPVLDAAIDELTPRDREAVIMRFFEGCPFSEVGAALGQSENTVRMRVERALEKLRISLERGGLRSTTAALGAALAESGAIAAPAELVSSIAAIAGSAGGAGTTLAVLKLMSTSKLIAVTTAAVFAGLSLYEGMEVRELARARDAIAKAQSQLSARVADAERRAFEAENRARALVAENAARPAAAPAVVPAAVAVPVAAVPEPSQSREPVNFVAGALIPLASLHSAGLETLDNALQTNVYAMLTRDPSLRAVSVTLDAGTRPKVAALLQALPEDLRENAVTPERLATYMRAVNFNAVQAAKWTALRVVSRDERPNGDSSVGYQMLDEAGQTGANYSAVFRNGPDGWHEVFPDFFFGPNPMSILTAPRGLDRLRSQFSETAPKK